MAQQDEIINRIKQLLEDKYVFPEVAQKMIADLEEKSAAGKYDQMEVPTSLAEAITSDLQEISQDKHLRVVFDPKRVAGIRSSAGAVEEHKQHRIEIERRHNFGFRKVERLKGNIGYLDLCRFADPELVGEIAAAAMRFLAESEAVIIDLRHNGGGNPGMVQLLCSYFFAGDRPIHLNSIYSRPTDTTWDYWTLPFVPGKRLPDVDLYILTSGHTFSGAEELAYNMAALERATIIGETTAGGANPMGIEIIDDDFYIAVPHGTPTNPITGDNWEAKGVEPHLKVDQMQALEVAHLKALERLIASQDDPNKIETLSWLLEEVRTIYQPVEIAMDVLEKYPGDYGEHSIKISHGDLYFRQRFLHFQLRPLSDTIFWLDGPDMLQPFRVEICGAELYALYSDGRRVSLGEKK